MSWGREGRYKVWLETQFHLTECTCTSQLDSAQSASVLAQPSCSCSQPMHHIPTTFCKFWCIYPNTGFPRPPSLQFTTMFAILHKAANRRHPTHPRVINTGVGWWGPTSWWSHALMEEAWIVFMLWGKLRLVCEST